MRAVVFGDEQQARRVPVEPVDDSRPQHAADAGQVDAVGEQRVHKCMPRVARRRMHGQAGRLIDNQQVVVFIDDAQGDCFRLDVEGQRRWDSYLNLVAGPKQGGRLGATSVDRYESLVDEATCVRT